MGRTVAQQRRGWHIHHQGGQGQVPGDPGRATVQAGGDQCQGRGQIRGGRGQARGEERRARLDLAAVCAQIHDT